MSATTSLPYLLLRRLFAFLYDCLLLIAVLFVVTGVAVVVNDNEQITSPARFLLFGLVGFLYFAWFWRRDGRTLGLQAWKLHVTSDDASMLTWKQCVIRFLAGLFFFGATYATMFVRADRKAIHDLLSGTNISFRNKNL